MSKVWFITGSSRGLGRGLAEAVAACGDRLVATARKPEQLSDLIDKYPGQVLSVALDVTDPEASRSAMKAGIDAFGRVDVLVNNAGYGNIASIEDITEEDFRAQMDTNFYGVVNVTRAALPWLRKQGSGHIFQISTIGGRLGTPGLSAYQSAKWAVEGFSEVLSREVGPLGIKVTIVEPGGFRTDWAGSSMTIAETSEAYKATVGGVADYIRANTGKQNGDPAKAAQAILQVAGLGDPPLRLLLGSDAVWLATTIAQQRIAEDEKWRHISLSTDFDAHSKSELPDVVK